MHILMIQHPHQKVPVMMNTAIHTLVLQYKSKYNTLEDYRHHDLGYSKVYSLGLQQWFSCIGFHIYL